MQTAVFLFFACIGVGVLVALLLILYALHDLAESVRPLPPYIPTLGPVIPQSLRAESAPPRVVVRRPRKAKAATPAEGASQSPAIDTRQLNIDTTLPANLKGMPHA